MFGYSLFFGLFFDSHVKIRTVKKLIFTLKANQLHTQ